MSAIVVDNISLRFGGLMALSNVSFTVPEGQIFALIGPNGAGKTTLFNVISGIYACMQGRVMLGGADVTGLPPYQLAAKGLTRTFQNLQIFSRMTAVENVMVGCHTHERLNPLADILGLPSVRRQNAKSRKAAIEKLDMVGLADSAERPAGELPYGALKRLEIARSLASEPTVIMLDEPVAGCNAVETEDVSKVIRNVCAASVTVVLVEHDMGMVMQLADRIHVLNRGTSLAEGPPQAIVSNPAVIEAYLGSESREAAKHAHG
jgi:branched-chain amino acid transport system ATP-binding protein